MSNLGRKKQVNRMFQEGKMARLPLIKIGQLAQHGINREIYLNDTALRVLKFEEQARQDGALVQMYRRICRREVGRRKSF